MRFICIFFIGLVFSTNSHSKNYDWNLVNFSYGAKIYHSSKILKKGKSQRQTFVVIDYLRPINKIYNSVLYKIDVDCKTKKIKFSQKIQYTSKMANRKMANGKIAKTQPAKLERRDFGKWYLFSGVSWWTLTVDSICNFDNIAKKKKQKKQKYNLTTKKITTKKYNTKNKSVSNKNKITKKTYNNKITKKKTNPIKNNALSKKRIQELKSILSKEEFRQIEALFGTKFIEEITLLDEKNWRAFIDQIKKNLKPTQQIKKQPQKKQSQKKQPQKKEFKKQEMKKRQIKKQKFEKKSFKKEEKKKKEFKIEVEKKNTYKK